MRSLKAFTIDIVRNPPILFPLVGLFHILWLSWTIWDDRKEPLDSVWLEVIWLAVYTFFWIAVCDLRKWAAIGYFAVTLLNVALFILIKNGKIPVAYMSDMLWPYCLFSFFLLVFYKRLR